MGWDAVFYMLSILIFLGILPLLRKAISEIKEIATIYKLNKKKGRVNSIARNDF